MAATYTTDQLNTVSRLQAICATILDNMNQARLLVTEATDKGYASGGANAIVDATLQSGSPAPYPQLAAADLANAITALTAIDTALAATTRTGYKALERMRP